MRPVRKFIFIAAVGVALAVVAAPASARTLCRNFEASHNGTDMFHPSGAVGAAVNKLVAKVDAWQREKSLQNVRMGKVRTKCGPWFQKYLLPHRNCVAKARACGKVVRSPGRRS